MIDYGDLPQQNYEMFEFQDEIEDFGKVRIVYEVIDNCMGSQLGDYSYYPQVESIREDVEQLIFLHFTR